MKTMVKGNIFRKETACVYVQTLTQPSSQASAQSVLAPQEKSSEGQGVTGSRQTAQYHLVGKTLLFLTNL